MTVSLSRKDKIIQTGWSLHLKMFHLICIVWQIPMVEMFVTNMNHKLPLYVASPGCKCSEHRCIKHLVGGSGLLGFLCQLTCQSADIMSSLCGVGVRVRVNNFSSKTTRPRDVLFFLKDTLSIEDENLFKACKSVCSSVC